MSKLDLGPVGMALNVSPAYLGEAAEAERLGYSAIWLPGGQIDHLGLLAEVMRATRAVPVASAIVSLDVYPPGSVTDLYADVQASAPACASASRQILGDESSTLVIDQMLVLDTEAA